MAIQEKIDRQLSDAGRNVPQIVIKDDSGPVTLPVNVSATFKNCTISNLTTAGNSRVNVEGGTVSSMSLKGTALIARNCTISGGVTLDENTKAEFDTVTCSAELKIVASTLTSKKSTFSQPWTATAKSMIRSVLDTFSGSKLLTASDIGTAALFINGTINVTTLLALSVGAKVEIDGGTLQCTTAGDLTTASSLEVRNCSSFQATTLFTLHKGSRGVFRKMPQIKSTNGFTLVSKSYVEILDVQTVDVTNTMFTMDNSQLKISRFTTLKTTNKYFQCTTNSFVRVDNGTNMKPTARLGDASNSTFEFDKITTIEAQTMFNVQVCTLKFTDIDTIHATTNGAFDLNNSTAVFNGCKTVKGDADGFIIAHNISTVTIKDCQTLTGSSGVYIYGNDQGQIHIGGVSNGTFEKFLQTDGIWTVTVNGNGTLHSSGNLIVMSSNGGSTLNCAANNVMQTDGDSVIYVTGVDTFLTALPNVTNGGSRYTIKGDDGGSQKQQIKLSKVVVQGGGISLRQYHGEFFASVFKKFNFYFSDITLARCEQRESQSADNSTFEGSIIKDAFGAWDSSITSILSVVEFQRTSLSDVIKPRNSVLRLDILRANSGITSDSASLRGSFIEAHGFDIGTTTSSSTKKDTFFFTNVGNPTYSGRGSLLVMESGEPDQGNMDYIMIKDNNLRIFDYRNCYMDVTNDHHRYTPDNIQDDADNNIYVTAQLTLDLKGVQSAILESDSTVTIQAPTINEQS